MPLVLLHHDLYLRIDYPNTHWRFGLRNMGLKGPQILDVTLMGAQYNSPQYLIKRAGLAEMFVPYDDRSHTYYDMSFGDDRMDQMDTQDLPAQNGALVFFRTLPGALPVYVRDTVPKVAVECRDEGVAWLCKEPGSRVRRRAQEVVVWAVFDAFNYDYIIEYTFHEDGRITFRNGATGYNLPGDTSEPHVHNGLWRVSTKLLNREDNEVAQFEHVEDANGHIATDSYVPVTNEETADWDQLQFSSLTVQSQTQTNDYGHLIGYQFYPYNRQGQAASRKPLRNTTRISPTMIQAKTVPGPARTIGCTPGTRPTAICCHTSTTNRLAARETGLCCGTSARPTMSRPTPTTRWEAAAAPA